MTALRLYVAQRLTAALMVPMIAVHLVTIIYAINAGLSAEEILSRTRGSVGWGGFYALFVICAAIHGSIGIRTVLQEWTLVRARGADVLSVVFCVTLLILGMRAVVAVVS